MRRFVSADQRSPFFAIAAVVRERRQELRPAAADRSATPYRLLSAIELPRSRFPAPSACNASAVRRRVSAVAAEVRTAQVVAVVDDFIAARDDDLDTIATKPRMTSREAATNSGENRRGVTGSESA